MERHAFAFKIKEGCFEQSRQDTFCWETRMLEIMERFTDDVDWITKERHPQGWLHIAS